MIGLISIDKADKKFVFKHYKINIDENENISLFNIIIDSKFNEKIYKKIAKIISKKNFKNVILSNRIYEEHENFVSEIYESNLNVVKGNELYVKMLDKTLEYILSKNTITKIEQINLGIAIENITYSKLEFIKLMASKVRSITILTSVPAKFVSIKKEVLDTTGVSILVTNNFKNGLKNCNINVNFDISDLQVLNAVSNRCILINCNDKIVKVRKGFKGIIVNDINVSVQYSEFRSLAVMQALNATENDLSILSLSGLKKNINDSEFEHFRYFENNKKKTKKSLTK